VGKKTNVVGVKRGKEERHGVTSQYALCQPGTIDIQMNDRGPGLAIARQERRQVEK